MIAETKDSIANVTTITGAGAVFMDWDAVLTIILITTGIVLNVLRIIEIRRKKRD